MAGSSALIISFLKGLIQFYELSDTDLSLPIQANLALRAEREQLNISAGYQDRVVQTYGGLMYMDFAAELMQGRGYGEYERLKLKDKSVLKGLWLAYVAQPKNSGSKLLRKRQCF